MPSNQTKITWVGDAQQFLAEQKKIDSAREREIQHLQRQLKASKTAAIEEKNLRREVAAAIEKARTPAEAYLATMNRYKKALQEGMIQAKDFNRLRDVELAKLNATKAAVDKKTDSLKKLNTELDKTSGAAEETTSGFGGMSLGMGKATAAAAVLIAALDSVAQAKRRVRQERQDEGFNIDQASRMYAIQAGITTEAGRIQARDQILQVGRDNAVGSQDAFDAATQLLGSGVQDPKALDFFLKLRAGANEQKLRDSDPRALIEGMSQFLGGMGQDKSYENFEDLGQRIRGLFQNPLSAAVQVQDLADFAKAAPAFAMTGTSSEDALSMLAVLRGGMPSAAEASTGARAVVTRLAASGATKTGEDALAMMGLKTADVDMVGETLPQVLRVLKNASDKLAPEVRNVAMTKLFGAENLGAGLLAINSVDQMEAISKSQINREAFTAGYTMFQTGRAADMRRAKMDSEMLTVENEDQILMKAVVDQKVKTARDKKAMERQGLEQTATLLEELSYNRAIDMLAETGAVSQEQRLEDASQTSVGNYLKLGLPPSWRAGYDTVSTIWGPGPNRNEQARQEAQEAVRGSNADDGMRENNAILRQISSKLEAAPIIPPANPQLQGRLP